MGVDGLYKSPSSFYHPRSIGCTDLQCPEQQQLVNIPGLKDPMKMQDLNTIQEPISRQIPQLLQNSNSFRGSEDFAEKAAIIGQILGDNASVRAQENGIGKRNNLNDMDEHDSSTDVSKHFLLNISGTPSRLENI